MELEKEDGKKKRWSKMWMVDGYLWQQKKSNMDAKSSYCFVFEFLKGPLVTFVRTHFFFCIDLR